MFPLHARAYPRLTSLFGDLPDHHLFCAGVLAGDYSGTILVDDPERPSAAFLFKPGIWCYLGGDPTNKAFNRALANAIAEKDIVGENAWALLCHINDAGWQPVLDTLIPNHRAIAKSRYLYLAESSLTMPVAEPAPGYHLHFIDQELATAVPDLPGPVQNVLDLRTAHDEPDRAAFGYAALHNDCAVAWAMVDCIVGDRGDIGLETLPAHRRRGLALAACAATIDYGLAHGLAHLHWDVAAHNAPSINLARQLGLRQDRAYENYLLIYPETSYLANVAWDHLDRADYSATLAACEPLLAQPDGGKYGHYLSGAAHAGLGDATAALDHLRQAIDHGWDDLTILESAVPWQGLHGSPEWKALIGRLSTKEN